MTVVAARGSQLLYATILLYYMRRLSTVGERSYCAPALPIVRRRASRHCRERHRKPPDDAAISSASGSRMSRIAYVNGRYVPHTEAAVHIEDRGYQFADGVYEVIAVDDG